MLKRNSDTAKVLYPALIVSKYSSLTSLKKEAIDEVTEEINQLVKKLVESVV